MCEQDAACSGQGGKKDAFRQQLTDQPPAAGSEGNPHRQLASSRRRTRQQEVADVCARDQQNERDDYQ